MAIADNFTGLSGAHIVGGRPTIFPAWMTAAGVALNKLVEIPNSSIAGTSASTMTVAPFSGFTSRRDTCELFSAACGGHGDSSDNGVYSFGPKGQGMLADNPRWAVRCLPTPGNQRVTATSTALNPYQPYDLKPTSRHSYDRHHYSVLTKEIILIGGTGLNGPGVDDSTTIHTYNVETDTWAAPIPFPSGYANMGYGITSDHISGLIWTGGINTYNPQTKTAGTKSSSTVPIRFPGVIANSFNLLFSLQIGDGWTASDALTVNASKIDLTTHVQTRITFNSSPAYTQFLDDRAIATFTAGMDFDDINGVFYWYQGQAGQENHLYVIHPNAGTVWDMTMFSFTSDSVTMRACANSGLCGRLKYFPLLKGVVIFPSGQQSQSATQNMYFLRTSI